MSDQIHEVVITPAQRFALMNLAHDNGQKVQGQRGRLYRRFLRAFGITQILDTADEHKGSLSVAMATSKKPAVFTLTDENIDYALGLQEVERAPAVERTLGSLWDALEAIKAKRPYDDDAGVPVYDPAAEDWAPPKALAEVPVAERIADYLRAQGHLEAATLVDGGGWDRPAPNGEASPQPEDRPQA